LKGQFTKFQFSQVQAAREDYNDQLHKFGLLYKTSIQERKFSIHLHLYWDGERFVLKTFKPKAFEKIRKFILVGGPKAF